MSATGKRRKSRELAMQMLFQADVGKHTPDQVRKTFWGSREEVDAETRGFGVVPLTVLLTKQVSSVGSRLCVPMAPN